MGTIKSILLALTALVLLLPAYAAASGGGGGLRDGCFDSVNTIPITCDGGIISIDENAGSCRSVTCTNSTSKLSVMACNKPDAGWPQYFEMYRQSITGKLVKKICFGDTCISDNGYARGEFPFCTGAASYCGDGIVTMPEQCDGNAPVGLVCSSDCVFYQEQACDIVQTFREGQSFNFTTPLYSYEVTLVSVTNQSVFLDFNGEVAPELAFDNILLTDEGTVIMLNDVLVNAREGVATICVQKPKPQNITLVIIPEYPFNLTYGFICRPNGNLATEYAWDFGDGTVEYFGGAGAIHTYAAPGEYTVTCNVTNSVDEASASSLVLVRAGPPEVNVTNTTQNSTNQTACYSGVQNIPATCTGGYIVRDTFNGCRTILCANAAQVEYATSGLQILACDKGGFFEIYKQNQLGNAVSKLCIGDTCIDDNGFARSANYPICVGNVTPPTNQTNGTGNHSNRTDTRIVNLTISPWYPKGNDYIFVCNVNGFTPTSYDWQFGDGQALYSQNQNNVYHTYVPGSYTVRCTAKNDQQLGTGTLAITVGGAVIPPVNQTNGTNTTPTVNQTNQTNTTLCYNDIKNIPAICTGGPITQDNYTGCRAITCSAGGSNLQVLACDKPDGSAAPARFEMYKQGQTGTQVTKICLGNACISDNGYASQNYPACIT